MKKLLFLFIGLVFFCTASVQAQDLLSINEFDIVNNEENNVTVQITVPEQNPIVLNRIAETNVASKAGFLPQINADDNLVTLNFTQNFNENELYTLLEYCGIKLNIAAFNELHNLINQ